MSTVSLGFSNRSRSLSNEYAVISRSNEFLNYGLVVWGPVLRLIQYRSPSVSECVLYYRIFVYTGQVIGRLGVRRIYGPEDPVLVFKRYLNLGSVDFTDTLNLRMCLFLIVTCV